MIKKFISILILFFLLIINVVAESEDKSVIKSIDTGILIVDKNKYLVKEKYNVYTKFGVEPNEHYFYKLFKNEMKINDKTYKFVHEIVEINSDTKNGYNFVKEGLLFYHGELEKLINENVSFDMEYYVKVENNIENEYLVVLSDNKYEVNEINFAVVFPFDLKEKEILFSKNGNKFENKISSLNYSIKDNNILIGKYAEKLNENEYLSLKVIESNNINKAEFKPIILLLILIPIVLIVFIIIIIKKRKLTN